MLFLVGASWARQKSPPPDGSGKETVTDGRRLAARSGPQIDPWFQTNVGLANQHFVSVRFNTVKGPESQSVGLNATHEKHRFPLFTSI